MCVSSRVACSPLLSPVTEPISTAMVKVTGAFQKSTEIMKTTNQLVKLPQLNATMREMSMEMMKVCSFHAARSFRRH